MKRRAFCLALLTSTTAAALGRIPHRGVLRMKLPWPTDSLDPHSISDPVAALFGEAVADALFAIDAHGRPYATLAATLPEKVGKRVRVVLRPNLVTARGKPLDARDVIFSINRSARAGGVGLLSSFGRVSHDPADGYAVFLERGEPEEVARALGSSVTAILPRGFNRLRPDGTGAFVAEPGIRSLRLRRNLNAARGAAYLDRIEIDKASDLRDALRSFEAGNVDMSWIEQYLHRPRPGAVKLDAGAFGWIVLRTGKDAGGWGAPGVAQRLLDAIPSARLAHLGLRGLGKAGGDPAWGGPSGELWVRDDAPHLTIVARELAAILSRPGHELRVAERPLREIEPRQASGRFVAMLDFARPIGAAKTNAIALLGAADPALAKSPPRTSTTDPRRIATQLPLGVVGELAISGAYLPAFEHLGSWDLPNVWRR